ncbi:hypothetical protein Ccrd_016441 [Cynara cardunculus var. scolymus]|uniref:Glycine rich protein n=1 Tax=Cynara cardunculus var. scolymus TaxID=59895 RepID=A0A103Y9Z8_CYNCS|nr:hypothetical protein Ccrd_016441 [Cynara cardunculus var. scolymus]
MASILKEGLVLALIIFMVVSSYPDTIALANAQSAHNRARQLDTNCDGAQQSQMPWCGGGTNGGSGNGGNRRGGGGGSGSSSCRFGCCGYYKWGTCKCC